MKPMYYAVSGVGILLKLKSVGTKKMRPFIKEYLYINQIVSCLAYRIARLKAPLMVDCSPVASPIPSVKCEMLLEERGFVLALIVNNSQGRLSESPNSGRGIINYARVEGEGKV